MWSKIFALHPEVVGWNALLDEYWIGHDQEPFADCWENVDLLKSKTWDKDYYVTSVSCPYMLNGTPTIPNIVSFAAQAIGCNLKPIIGILGRDRNVLGYQETRVRGNPTYTQAVEQYKKLESWDPVHISYELLHLYKGQYLKQLSKTLEFPIDYANPKLEEIIVDDTNNKYFQPVEHHWVDDLAKHTSRKWR